MTENRVTLTGFASLPADTFAEGPETGADIDTTRTGPFPGQPVGGWSGVQFADKDSYWFIVDSLFGGNSDTLARIYQVDPNFAGIEGGDGSVEIENFITLSDPNNLVPFEIRNEDDPERPLTGTDFDTEALVIDSNGDLWVGDEYGPYLLHFDSNGVLLEAPIDTPNIPQLNTLNGQEPINIGHRGASGLLPEHTLAGFQLALEQGANFIETDYVMTSDGVPIVRHEPLLNNTTDISDRPEYSDRETTKTIDGVEYTGFFAEDFTLAEIKTLRARQPRPERSDEFDDLYEIPTMAEVIQLVKDYEASTGQQVGIVHELKHNSYFDSIGLNVEEATVRVLVEEDFTNPQQNIIQTFEIAPLISLDKEIMPEAGIDLPLHQLTGAFSEEFSPGFSFPYDVVANFSNPDFTEEDARAVYGELVDIIDLGVDTGYGDLLALPEFYQFMSTYAEAVNPWKNTILLRELLEEPVDGDGDGNAEIGTQLTGEVFPLIEYAHDAGLLVNVYTLRDEERYLTLNPDGTVQNPQQEAEDLIRLGADGLIGDFPATIETVLDGVLADEVRSPQNPEVETGEEIANLRGSRGFEGIGYSPDRTTLYPILEAPVDGDPENSLRIYEYDIETGTYSDELIGLYPLSDSGDTPTFQLGDLTPINDTEFLAIERDDFQAEEAFFKKIFKIDISQVDENGFVQKTELVDLLDIADPEDLNNDGDTDFTLPITSVEDVLVIDEKTVLVSVDNNYPFGDFATGRPPELDNNEIILVELPEPLDLDPRLGVAGLDFNPLEGSLDEYIGFENGSYFIEVPDGEINEFFNWNEQYPQLVSAHRGGFLPGFPENAIATFANTLSTAPALLEVDVRRTADGEWILMHDDDLGRTTNGTGLVEETTLAEIQTLQLVDNDGNLTPYKVPTLQEAILWAEGKTILELDIKSDDFAGEVAEIITELDGEDQVRFITQDIEQATEVYNINPEIHLGLFIIPENQESVFADVAAAPFTLESVSAFTGTQPQPAEFYQSLHDEGIVAIQGLFGEQDTFNGESIDNLSEEQRDTLFTTVFDNGADAIAADYYQDIASLIGYPVANEFNILLVNDDGFEAEGIDVLYDGLIEAGYNVTLVAPKEQQSGRGTLINVDSILQPTEVVKFADGQWYVDGSPVTTTIAGLDYILGGEEPDLVISGINEGANIDESIAISSGTVSAATTATRRGVPAIAVSAGGDTEEELDAAYETGTEFVIDRIEDLQETQETGEELLPEGVGLNVNIPGTFAEGVDGIQGVALTELDETSNIDLRFGELPEGFGEGAGVLVDFNENISPDEIEDPTSEGENFLAGNITVTPVDGSWVADASISETIASRATAEIAPVEVTPLDILLTNDDGFEAEGIEVLYNELTAAGHNVTLVAPEEQQSGTGTALDVDAILQPTKVVNYEENKWYVDAGVRTTTWAGLDFILEETPDLVISGINEGENIGAGGAVSSGTVSAAVTAILRDVPAIAVSAGIDLTDPESTATEEAYQIGADYVTDLVAQLQATQGDDATILPSETGLSINIPVRFPEGIDQIQGVAFTEPDGIEPFIIDFGELPEDFGGGVGLRFAPFELTEDTEISSTSEGGQFLSGFITVTALNGNWTADEAGIADVGDRLENFVTEPDTEQDIIDLTTFTVEVRSVNDAAFANIGGFYQAIDNTGAVIDPVTGAEVAVGDAGYKDAALANSVVQIGDGENATLELDGGMVYVPYILANGTRFFSAFEDANPDGLDHVQSLGENTFGFEDLLGGGDNDFNDFVISLDIA